MAAVDDTEAGDADIGDGARGSEGREGPVAVMPD